MTTMHRKSKPSQATMLVVAKYQAAGWQTLAFPDEQTVHVIAQKTQPTNKLHYIRCVPAFDDTYARTIKNDYVQHAFSGGALPVFAVVNITNGKIALRDVNLDQSVNIVSKPAAKKESKESKESKPEDIPAPPGKPNVQTSEAKK